MNLIKSDYFKVWKSLLDIDIQREFSYVEHQKLEPYSFTFYTSVSVMSSSRIEGEQLDIDSYVKHKVLDVAYLPELTEKPNDLYNAYLFAKDNKLNAENFPGAHQLITAHLLPEAQTGVLRKTEMLVMEHKTGRIQFEAATLTILEEEYKKLWSDIQALLKKEMSIEEVFYFAAYIHFVFVSIHPYADGNGRIGRLMEKWFLSEKLGERAWYIQSEKYYYQHVNSYYKNLSRAGMFYDQLTYEKAIPFLLMLPQSLIFDR